MKDDNKLREEAEKLSSRFFTHYTKGQISDRPELSSSTQYHERLTEAVIDFHKSQMESTPSIDLTELKNEYCDRFKDRDTFYPFEVWNFFEPYIKKSQMESDAVEFADFILKKPTYKDYIGGHSKENLSWMINGNQTATKELYQLFLKSKTDKTE